MKSPENDVEEEAEKTIKLELLNNQLKENLKIKEALKKQEPWRGLIED